MANYTQDEKATELELLSDVQLSQQDVHVIGDESDSGKAKAITQDNLEIHIANSETFIDTLIENDYFIDELTNNNTFIENITNNTSIQPLTSKGDIFTHNGTTVARLPVGTDGQIVVADSTQSTGLRWASAAFGGGGGGGTKIHIDTEQVNVSAPGSPEVVVGTAVIPGGTLGTNNAIRFKVVFNNSGDVDGNDDATIRVKYGGTTVSTVVMENNAATGGKEGYMITGVIIADEATNAQKAQVDALWNVMAGTSTNNVHNGYGSSTVDSMVDQDLEVTVQFVNGNSDMYKEAFIVEKITESAEDKLVGVGTATDKKYFNIQVPLLATLWGGSGTINSYSVVSLNATAGDGDLFLDEFAGFPTGGAGTFTTFGDEKELIFEVSARYNDTGNDFFIGFNTMSDGTPTESVGFGNFGTGFCLHSGDGVGETNTTVSAPSNGVHVFRVEYDSGSGVALFFIDGSSVGSLSTTLPDGADVVGFLVYNEDTVSSSIQKFSSPSFAIEQ